MYDDDRGYGPARYDPPEYGPAGYGPPEYGPPGYGPPGYGGPGYPPGGRRRRRGLSHVVVAVLAAAVAVGVTEAAYHPARVAQGPARPGVSAPASPGALPAPSAPSAPAAPGSAAPGSQQAIAGQVQPGLVVINTTLQYTGESAAGTGMVISPDGLVLTNNHVIAESTNITATVVSTGRTYPAAVVGYDTTGDVAVIRLRGAAGLRTVPLGDSAAVTDGASVLAMGNAGGQGSITPAGGQVTGLDQTITATDSGSAAGSETLHGMIETNADVIPGDSGGPLVSAAGQVIGMDTAGNDAGPGGGQTTGFAIPINTALSVAREITAGQASSVVTIGYPPFLGIFTATGQTGSPLAQAQNGPGGGPGGLGDGGLGGFSGFGGPGGVPSCYTSNSDLATPADIAPVSSGTLVVGTICAGPAATAGMTGGSVITAVNGTAVGPPGSLAGILAGLRPGQDISVTWVSPAGQRVTSRLRLAAGPPL
jgi:S1-C subfamily serine protease